MSKKILIVDDNKDFLEMIKVSLEQQGYGVYTVSDPWKFEEYIDIIKPDLMIIDVYMPERSGFNILEDIKTKEKYVNIPKVFLTGLDDDIERLVAKALGVCEYLVKPVEPGELTKAIEKCICQRV